MYSVHCKFLKEYTFKFKFLNLHFKYPSFIHKEICVDQNVYIYIYTPPTYQKTNQ